MEPNDIRDGILAMWRCGFLIAHHAHHRGRILLALKQSGMRLPDEIAIEGIWAPGSTGCSASRMVRR